MSVFFSFSLPKKKNRKVNRNKEPQKTKTAPSLAKDCKKALSFYEPQKTETAPSQVEDLNLGLELEQEADHAEQPGGLAERGALFIVPFSEDAKEDDDGNNNIRT